jgi:hypothetical protein
MGRMSDLDIQMQEDGTHPMYHGLDQSDPDYPDCLTVIGLAMSIVENLKEVGHLKGGFQLEALYDVEQIIKRELSLHMTTLYQP